MCSRACPFQHSCLVDCAGRKERRSHLGIPRSDSHERAEKGDPSFWKEVYEWGKQNAGEFDFGPYVCMPGTTGRQQHRVNVQATNSESHLQRAVNLPLIDHLIQETNDRPLSQEDRFLGQYLLPTKLQRLSNDVQVKMYAAYTKDLTEKREYDSEMLRRNTDCCIQL